MKKISMSFQEIPLKGDIAIYGTGKRGQDYYKILTTIRPDVNIACFLDSFREDIHAFPKVLKASKENIDSIKLDVILVCSEYLSEIEAHLKGLGIVSDAGITVYAGDWFSENLPSDEARVCQKMYDVLFNKLPDEPFVYDALGRIKIQQSDFSSALDYYSQAIKKFPNDIWGYAGYAKALFMMNRLKEASIQYQKIMHQFFERPIGYSGYANALVSLNRYEEAEVVFNELISKFSQFPSELLNYADFLVKMNRHEEAVAFIQKTTISFPDNLTVLLKYAHSLVSIGRYDKAEALFRETIKKHPDTPDAPLEYARYLASVNRYEEAETIYREASNAFTNNYHIAVGHMGTLVSMGRLIEAEELYKALKNKYPHITEIYTNIADILTLTGTPEKAENILLSAKGGAKKQTTYQVSLLNTYIAQGKKNEAQKVLNQLAHSVTHTENKPDLKQVLFDHFYKCGGTTIRNYLLQNYNNTIRLNLSHLIKYKQNLVNYYRSLSDGEKRYYTLIHGPYASRIMPDVPKDTIKTVMIRQPIDRLLSEYYFQISRNLMDKNCTLAEYIENHDTYYIKKLSTPQERKDLQGTELIEKCYSNICQQYDLVGITQEMDLFLNELQCMADLPIPFTNRKINITAKRKSTKTVDPKVIELATQRLDLDIQLFNLVKKDVDSRKK